MKPGESLKSIVEFSSIMLEAGKLVVSDTVDLVKSVPSRLDAWVFDYGGEDD